MSDLSNLFSQRQKPSTPIKRLFMDDFSTTKKQSQTRSRQPNKSIRKYKEEHHKNTSLLQSKDFAKRYVQKEDIKKQLNHFNQQILLIFIRRMFFIMGGIIFFNIFFTSAQRQIILSNMLLALMLVDINLGSDIIGNNYFIASKEIVKMVAYCINFYLFFQEFHTTKANGEANMQMILVSINAGLNYVIFTLCQPLVALVRVNNYEKPYVSYYQRAKIEIKEFLRSLETLYYLRKPILLLNLIYWLFIVLYIMYVQSETLLNELLTLQTLKSFTLAAFILYVFMYLINKINEVMKIQLLSSNKKTVNISILRLDCQNVNNERIANEVLKYIWKNCEMIWDIQLLAHSYSINYDIIEDYLNIQLQKINERIIKTFRNLQPQYKISKKKASQVFSFIRKWQCNFQQVLQIHQLACFMKKKQYLFYIIEHIIYFQTFSNDFPINVKGLHKKIVKISEALKLISENIKINELKYSFHIFCCYFHDKLMNPLSQ